MVHFWVNPNSIRTYHSVDNFGVKEKELAQQFAKTVYAHFSVRKKEADGSSDPEKETEN